MTVVKCEPEKFVILCVKSVLIGLLCMFLIANFFLSSDALFEIVTENKVYSCLYIGSGRRMCFTIVNIEFFCHYSTRKVT